VRVAIFGLGYVGCVSAGCLARLGHHVIGVDLNPGKVEALAAGESPIVEQGLPELLREMRDAGRLTATTEHAKAVAESDLSVICVGTPSADDGRLDLSHVQRVSGSIAEALRAASKYHVVVLRSTVLPGTVEEDFLPALKVGSGKEPGRDFGVAYNPEFLREGSALSDFVHPPYTVVAATDPRTEKAVQELYAGIDAPFITTPFRTAEMLKYVNNTFHALKVAFANEVGNVCKSVGIDSHEVMEIFCRDTKLNISPIYLRPGFAFGGSCLPKDLRALTDLARRRNLESPLLTAVIESNQNQIETALKLIERTRKKRIGILGLTFKAGTDDIRESPIVKVVEALVGRGMQVKVHDENIDIDRMVGTNRTYLESYIPYLDTILCQSVREVVEDSEVVVVATGAPSHRAVVDHLKPDQILIDLVRVVPNGQLPADRYIGICW
jgi:GDP-mannose 6-dehydrogenase